MGAKASSGQSTHGKRLHKNWPEKVREESGDKQASYAQEKEVWLPKIKKKIPENKRLETVKGAST